MKSAKTVTGRLAITVLLFVLAFAAKAQQSSATAPDEKVYATVEQMPEYPGGNEALYKFVSSKLRYPKQALQAGIQGKVFVSFTVSKQGHVYDAKVEKGIGGGCDQEALRILELMEDWQPAKQNGQPVNFRYVMPIAFKLVGDEPKEENKK